MAVTITASLVPSGDPNPVQLLVSGVPAGVPYTVVGTAGGTSWPVPGGKGTSVGDAVLLVDNRSAVNTEVVYSVTADGVTSLAAPVTVAYAGRALLQSLDGQTSAAFVWQSNGLPRQYVTRSHTSDVPGRLRPPGRFTTGGAGGGSLSLRTSRENTAQLESMLMSGRPLVLRTDGAVRDLPPVELLLPLEASTVTWDAVVAPGMLSTDRVWALGYILVDDPEPSRVLAAWTGDDFDAAMATRTGDDFDALFVGSTWLDFDTYPWGQL